MPAKTTVLDWTNTREDFRRAYFEAREIQLRLLSVRTKALERNLQDATASPAQLYGGKERLQTHLRRVGQLAPKRCSFLVYEALASVDCST